MAAVGVSDQIRDALGMGAVSGSEVGMLTEMVTKMEVVERAGGEQLPCCGHGMC